MERRGFVVGVLATLAVGLAAGVIAGRSMPVSSMQLGGGGSAGLAGWALGGVLWLLVLAVLVAGGAWALLEHLRGGGGGGPAVGRRVLAFVLAVAVLVAGVLLVAVRVFGDGDGPTRQDGVGGPLLQGSSEPASAMGGPGPGVVLAVVVVAICVALLVVGRRYLARGRDGDATEAAGGGVDPPRDPSESPSGGDALADAASRAADYLDGSGRESSNDVVRAWRELADVLDVARPATSTPREFATAAIDAGVDPTAVSELTTLFEAVRYGDRPPTPDRTERAIAALERIDATEHTDSRNDPRNPTEDGVASSGEGVASSGEGVASSGDAGESTGDERGSEVGSSEDDAGRDGGRAP
jgi:hypothetical protein